MRSCANRALINAVGDLAIVQPQGSVRLDLFYEPEPDLVLLRPQDDFYATRDRTPGDVLLVIEIADSSLAYDRDMKAPIYAMAGIGRVLARRSDCQCGVAVLQPRTRRVSTCREYHRGESIAPLQLPTCVVPVDAFLIG